ncbi:MAG: hypothetical protein KGL39_07925 [Patescibacteria group bacterium]|nr:hypothetical protein [Patescibacteria group bacterium]
MAESNFDKLKNKIERKEGYSDEGAAGAAYEAGVKKYGKEGMAEKAAAGRRSASTKLSAYARSRGAALSRGSKRCT